MITTRSLQNGSRRRAVRMHPFIRSFVLACALVSSTSASFGAMFGFESGYPNGFVTTLDIRADDDPAFFSHWFQLGGTPRGTPNIRHGGDHSLFNNGNDDIGVRFDADIDFNSAWLIGWAAFPTQRLDITGYNNGALVASMSITSLPTSWTQYNFGSAFDSVDEVRFHTLRGTQNFGTFAIDDINVIPVTASVPESGQTAALLVASAGLLLAARRKSDRQRMAGVA